MTYGSTEKSANRRRSRRRWLLVLVSGLLIVYFGWDLGASTLVQWYTGEKSAWVEYPSSREISRGEFRELERQIYEENIARSVAAVVEDETDPIYKRVRLDRVQKLPSQRARLNFHHIERFREAGIMRYEGPETCIESCHQEMTVMWPDGVRVVDTMEDVLDTSHFRFFASENGSAIHGHDTRVPNGKSEHAPFPVAQIGRTSGVTGTFTWTGWAQLIQTKPESSGGKVVVRSEGCGQCHIGGLYGPPTDAILPISIRDANREHAIDCLVCHSASYDMNERYVVDDGVGRRWNQDRSMKAALSVTRPQARMCLRCHQHNAGDAHLRTDADQNLGHENARLVRAAKRGTAYGPADDVHVRAGLDCLDCHTARGHKIARGRAGADLVSNDLPDVDVSCVLCHTAAPHYRDPRASAILNGHSERVACETCHITRLADENMVLVDWLDPVWDPEEGIYAPRVVLKSGKLNEAVEYLWFNNKGTVLGNALGANPNRSADYNPLMNQLRRYDKVPGLGLRGGGVEDNDFLSPLSAELRGRREQMIEETLRPVMSSGESKIYPFKLFNARMFEDIGDEGPFGSMILPFDHATYYETGDARKAMGVAMRNPFVERIYEGPPRLDPIGQLKELLGLGESRPIHPLSPEYGTGDDRIRGLWMRQSGTLMINHGISRDGLSCESCHVEEGGHLDWAALGYDEEQIEGLVDLPEPIPEKMMNIADVEDEPDISNE